MHENVTENRIDSVLRGAIDFHRHGYPEISNDVHTRLTDVEDMQLCREAGFGGVVLKSHMWPTVGRAYHLKRLVPGIAVIPSITLNHSVGGLNPLAVQAAASQGARVVFFPTWSARHDIERGGMSAFIGKTFPSFRDRLGPPISLLEGGKLRAEAKEVLSVATDNGMVICTGHISPEESLAVAESGLVGDNGLIFSHPDSHSVGASGDHITAMAEAGAVIELCALGTLPPYQRVSIQALRSIVDSVGSNRCILTTDYFFPWSPPSAETMRMFAGVLLQEGVSEADLRCMLRSTPARLLEGGSV